VLAMPPAWLRASLIHRFPQSWADGFGPDTRQFVPYAEQQAGITRLGCRKAAPRSPSAATIQEGTLMNFIIWLIVGGVVGWLASIIMRTDAQQGILLNIVVGIVGAFLAGLIVGHGSINNAITIQSFLYSLLGAVVLLGVVNLVRRGSVR
jgi:uncharacterized membrane protein YeaQ/YmgE (transglycosylase-associated protein family)